MQIANAQTVNGSTQQVIYLGSREYGRVNVYVTGSLGGGTLTLEAKAPDSAFIPVQTLPVGMTTMDAAPMVYRLTLAGATGANFSAYAESDSEFTQDKVRNR